MVEKIECSLLTVFGLSLCTSYLLGYTPAFLLLLFSIASLVTYLAYRRDKQAAVQGGWRVSEASLHWMALLCGWPGALIAQQSLRHKTRKRRFRVVFWFLVAVNMAAFGWLHTPAGGNHMSVVVAQMEAQVHATVQSKALRKTLLTVITYQR